MTTPHPHQGFPPRPYASTLGQGKLPERNIPLGFGASTTAGRDNARLERERLDRERQAQVQASQSVQQGAMAQLTDEQRDEINEAVSIVRH